jgi:cytoskeletal protein RodZ
MDQIEYQQPEGADVFRVGGADVQQAGSDLPPDCGVGAFLRDERQRKGLDHHQISEITRIRPHFLKAIENEDWEHLPSAVFVKSFIRSYARALGLEAGDIVARYHPDASADTCVPEPIQKPRKSSLSRVTALLFVLLVAAIVYSYWRSASTPEETSTDSQHAGAVSEPAVDSEPAENVEAASGPPSNAQEERREAPVLTASETATVGDVAPETLTTPVETALEIIRRESLRRTPESPEDRVEGEQNAASPKSETGFENAAPELILTATVLEKTWVRIFVDGKDPKEYIFRPGSKPEWRASEGFELLIGNAGGIQLELNGREMKKLGRPGQVVRLNLPEGYTRSAL